MPRVADLNGDGLSDLWGNSDGELRAFRGEAPEVWRALGSVYAAGSSYGRFDATGSSAVDLDGDGISDTMVSTVRAPGASVRETTGSHTALARSGHDGHVIWKTVLDPRESWFEPDRGESYSLSASPLPEGDLNGDGIPDVIVQKYVANSRASTFKPAATLPLQVLSGRDGRLLWRAGPLPLGFEAQGYSQISSIDARAVEPSGAPDLIVRHGSPFVKPGASPTPISPPRPTPPDRPSLARVSGRDGQILWDVALEESMDGAYIGYVPEPQFADLNGDGGLDVILVLPLFGSDNQTVYTMRALSLCDGRRLWSQALRFQPNFTGPIHLGDLDGDKRPDVVVMEELAKENSLDLEVRAFDGRDGSFRWTWKGGAQFPNNRPPPLIALANLDGNGTRKICVNFKEWVGLRRIVILDGKGNEVARRDVTGDYASLLKAADLDGDGRDELLVRYGEKLWALDRKLNEIWSRPNPSATVDHVLPGASGQPGKVIVPWALALDGATGQARWTGQNPLVYWPDQFGPKLLDPGDSSLPLLIGNGLGATVCRVALPTTDHGTIAPAQGSHVQPGRIPDDPRWTRSLPWVAWLAGPLGPWGFLAAAGLAGINVVLPLLILRAIAGRRRFSIRALMALPVAAAIPLMAFLMLEPFLPVGSTPLLASEKRVFAAGTLAGLPIAVCLVWIARSLARLRWRPAATMAALTALATLAIAAVWLWFDMKSMAAIEHYGSSRWYLVTLPGAYAAAILALTASIVLRIPGFVKRLRRAGISRQAPKG
jgi:hypothetical protein